jgi:ketosteroid isomerase-like protein
MGTERRVVSKNLSDEEIEVLREGYRLFAEHDPAYMDRWTDDARIELPESLPAGGTYAGWWDALEFTSTISERLEDPHPEPEEFIRDGDRVVVLARWHAVAPATGREFVARVAHVFTRGDGDVPFADQKVTSFELIGDTQTFLDALAEADSD